MVIFVDNSVVDDAALTSVPLLLLLLEDDSGLEDDCLVTETNWCVVDSSAAQFVASPATVRALDFRLADFFIRSTSPARPEGRCSHTAAATERDGDAANGCHIEVT